MARTRVCLALVFLTVLALSTRPPALAAQVPKTYLVDRNSDEPDFQPGDGQCLLTARGGCTLRAAIQEANLDGVPSFILFASPMTIVVENLPPLTANGTIIDASDKWVGNWPDGRPGVTITAPPRVPVVLTIQGDASVVRGIGFESTLRTGILMQGGVASVVGGTQPGQRNVFLSSVGVEVRGHAFGHMIIDNFFGTADGLTSAGFGVGVAIYPDASHTTVQRNLIVGYAGEGIQLGSSDQNFIGDNIIGANKDMSAPLPNAVGVAVLPGVQGNEIRTNHIVGNTGHGLDLRQANDNLVRENWIGAFGAGIPGNGGDGVHVAGSGNILRGNTILRNDGHGVSVEGDGNVLEGNQVEENARDGVSVSSGANNRVGGGESGQGNLFGNNNGAGVRLTGAGTTGTSVAGNYIGLGSAAGADHGNREDGVLIGSGASFNTIGGILLGQTNWIAHNRQNGITLTGSATLGNVVVGNVIGAPVDWSTPTPNRVHGVAIYDGAHDNVICVGNTIVASVWSGIAIADSDRNAVCFNWIGTDGTGANRGNERSGVEIVNGASNTVGPGNQIAYNGRMAGTGVTVNGPGARFNAVRGNSIHDNAGAGIRLLNGANSAQSQPIVTQATCQRVEGTACPGCTVEIFSDANQQGRIFEGTLTADPTTWRFYWTGPITGPNVTATATDGAGNTSEFSLPWFGACYREFLPLGAR